MVSTLALSPVVERGTSAVRRRAFRSSDWTALPMPRPHYRGAPAIWPDSYAAQVLAPPGARLVPLENRRFSSAPGGVVVVDAVVEQALLQEIASVVMFAGPVLFRVAAHLDAERGFDRASQERSRYQQMVDSLPDPVVITDASNDIVRPEQARRASALRHRRRFGRASTRGGVEQSALQLLPLARDDRAARRPAVRAS